MKGKYHEKSTVYIYLTIITYLSIFESICMSRLVGPLFWGTAGELCCLQVEGLKVTASSKLHLTKPFEQTSVRHAKNLLVCTKQKSCSVLGKSHVATKTRKHVRSFMNDIWYNIITFGSELASEWIKQKLQRPLIRSLDEKWVCSLLDLLNLLIQKK